MDKKDILSLEDWN